MKKTVFEWVGLHSDVVEHAYENAREFCKGLGLALEFEALTDDDLTAELSHCFDWGMPTDSFIFAIFNLAKKIIREAEPTKKIGWCINGYKSRLYEKSGGE